MIQNVNGISMVTGLIKQFLYIKKQDAFQILRKVGNSPPPTPTPFIQKVQTLKTLKETDFSSH